jgi:hypothetical protein
MAVVHSNRRRRRGLGAFDQAAWDAYQASGRTGAWQGPPNGSLEDPNGGTIYFDEFGSQDRYDPPAAFHPTTFGGTVHTDNVVEQNPSSTFYGWTEYEKAAFETAHGGGNNLVTDYVRDNTTPGTTTSQAVWDENRRRLLAFAASSTRIQNALKQFDTTGTFRGEQEATFQADEAANIKRNAQELLSSWLAHRDYLIAHSDGTDIPPRYPPLWFTGPLSPALAAALKALVDGLPPDEVKPKVPQIQQTLTAPTTTGGGGGGPAPFPTYTAPSFPSGGGGNAPIYPTNGGLTDANPGSSAGPVYSPSGGGPGFDAGGGGGAPSSGGGFMSSPLLLGAAALGALFLLRKRH